MASSSMTNNEVVITGIGLVTSMGVGAEANWKMLSAGAAPNFDSQRFAPYTVHPLPEIDWSEQISRRDQRQMEDWQRIGTYTAGLALEDAGLKGVEEYTSTMDMIIAAAGGERDLDVDAMILQKAGDEGIDPEVLINETLTTELRPTLFLAQLSNLLAGNISIVHKVTGSSRTFMGEEGAGISAIKTAAARIRGGQSTHALVGASFNAEAPDMLLGYEVAHHLLRGGWSPVFQRENSEGGGIISGSAGAFLVLESRGHAEERGARIYAELGSVDADLGESDPASTTSRLSALAANCDLHDADMLLSGASGAKNKLEIERAFLSSTLANVPARGLASAFGHCHEVQFPLCIALAALSVYNQAPVEQLDSQFESRTSVKPSKIGVLTLGYEEGEGAAMVLSAGKEAA